MEIKAKIGLRNMGLYDSSTEYDILDFVSANNALYISLKSGNAGHSLDDAEWWQRSIHGSDGITEKEVEELLGGYWAKVELEAIDVADVEALDD